MANIETKYDVWKNKLLDLGKRNRLLNYKDTLRSSVKIVHPECGDLWEMFVKNETTLVFPFKDERDNENEEQDDDYTNENTDDYIDEYIDEYEDEYEPNIQTNKNIGDLQKALRNLRSKAKTSIEEQGVNVLYLSFGFLEWTESDNSEETIKSPLVLVPVTLSVDSIKSPYTLTLHEDEIILNPTLIYKLENDYGIVLPPLDDTDDIEHYLNDVKSATSIKNWSVKKDVGLSLLSFLKINMYTDLNNHKETIIENPLVKAISGDTSDICKIPEGVSNYDFDRNEKPIDVFQVVDADASQQDAILMAKKGVSFVLQGPPGTGKSQTITNIIAESIADGKKVLFVSEKMAALDVVHRRLTNAGLDDFCLVLHSHKANKKNILEQLNQVLNLSRKKATLSDEAYQKLETLQADKNKLNDYANQVYEVINPLGKSIYEANGIVANLEEYEDFIFSIDNIRNVTKEQYNKYLYLLSKLVATIGKMSNDYQNNPWRDCHLPSISNEFKHDATSHLNILLPQLKELDNELGRSLVILKLELNHTLRDINTLTELLDISEKAFAIPPEWILTDELYPLYQQIDECTELKKKFLDYTNELNEQYIAINAIESRLKVSPTDSLVDIETINKEYDILTKFCSNNTPYLNWSKLSIRETETILDKASETAKTIHSLKEKLLKDFNENIFKTDCQSIFYRIANDYNWFSNEFDNNIEEYFKLLTQFKNLTTQLNNEYSAINNHAPHAEFPDARSYNIHSEFNNECEKLKKFRKDTTPYSIWIDYSIDEITSFLSCAKQKAELIHSIKNDLLKIYEPSVFDFDYISLLNRLKTEYTSFFKIFKKGYRQDQKAIRLLHRTIVKKISISEMISLAESLRTLNEAKAWFVANKEGLNKFFTNMDISENTDYNSLENHILVFNSINNSIKTIEQIKTLTDCIKPKEKLLKSYEQDKESLICNLINKQKEITNIEFLVTIQTLCEIQECQEWYLNEDASIKNHFGNDGLSELSDYVLLKKQISVFYTINQSIDTINSMIAIFNILLEKEVSLNNHFKFLYEGVLSDWDKVRNSLDWAITFKKHIESLNISEQFIKLVCQGKEFAPTCTQIKKNLENLTSNIAFDYDWFISHFDNSNSFYCENLLEIYNRFKACVNSFSLLEEWIDYNTARKDCINGGLQEFLHTIENHNIPTEEIISVFKKRFYRLWLDAVLPEYPAVQSFRRKIQEGTIEEFASLDKLQFEIAKARIKSKLINSLPSLEHFTDGNDEISILKRELNKQRKIMPIRRLFNSIPNLLLTLKPCLMMSPLSVSLFLEAATYQFDIVIFDEASQVCTENAIGAISRAKQVIIAGDSKQLPPTNFFKTTMSESDFDNSDDDDEYNDLDAYESILDEANMLPERTLRWHYRSRHESLIAFSNNKIYKNNLITFPSNIESAENNGVEYIYLPNGYYDKGGKKGNVVEAYKIADLVFKHFREQPNRSLGVIAFGEVQQQAIETAIREKRLENDDFEHFFAEDKEEAFFVKNLENVQGDERDTIIFSIGYAKDNSGVFRMNFGPLSKSGGERRLNVAITRAKYNVKLVGSIKPTDINIDSISSEGPKLLRNYIDFAINGPSVLDSVITDNDIVEHDSPFEEAVYKFLDRRGYKLATQVGCSGYRIDMAVKHPILSGIYVLGIECDGAAYHSARTARERDRLRQDVLENMGWKIYRIWSTDWIKDPIKEGEKLISAVEDAIASYGVGESTPESFESIDEQEIQADNFVNVEEKSLTEQFPENSYGFDKKQLPDFNSCRNHFGYLNLNDCIVEVVNKEYPIHAELLYQRLAPLLGNEKATVKVRREVDYRLHTLSDLVTCKGEFIFPVQYDCIPIRMPNVRKIQHISTEELAEAMFKILHTYVGTTREALCAETTRVYGFNRAGQNISIAMSNAVDYLIQQGKVEELEGKLRIIKQ